jgi:aerobic carbon-monoxide dehydrogenase medium subunit
VRPAPFAYHAPRDVDEVLALLAAHGDDAKVLAGGQSLVPMLALRLAAPALLVDIGRVGSLCNLSQGDDLEIGAGVTQRAVERALAGPASVPVLADALPLIAHPPIRNRGTVCGSLAHADPAAELPAVALALDATFVAASVRGVRRIPASQFFVSYLETALAPDELLLSVSMPVTPPGTGGAFAELSRRHGDFALAGVAAVVTVADGQVRDARLAACGVATTPVRLGAAEAMLRGLRVDRVLIDEVAVEATRDLDPPTDVHAPGWYRRRIVRVLTARALAGALGRAQ